MASSSTKVGRFAVTSLPSTLAKEHLLSLPDPERMRCSNKPFPPSRATLTCTQAALSLRRSSNRKLLFLSTWREMYIDCDYEFNRYRGLTPDQALVDSLLAQLAAKLDAYEVILGKQTYLAGNVRFPPFSTFIYKPPFSINSNSPLRTCSTYPMVLCWLMPGATS
jgi:hypothetical protein